MRGGLSFGDSTSFEIISMATRPVSPNAVVCARLGRCPIAQRIISWGGRLLRYAFIVAKSSEDRGSWRGIVPEVDVISMVEEAIDLENVVQALNKDKAYIYSSKRHVRNLKFATYP